MLKNNATGGWLKVRLRGNTSPAAGTGAVVSVNVNGVWQRRTITTHAGALGLVGDEAFFGLGDATTADEVSIQWPSGCTSQYTDVAGNQLHTFEETCADTAPTVAVTGSGCLGDPQTVTLGGGTAFAWYRTQAEEDAFLVSGTSVVFDTLTMTQTLYVANTSGDRPSRRMPVSLSAGTRPVFNVSMSHTGTGYQFTATSTDPAVTTYQWYLNDAPVATGNTYTATGLEAGEQWVCAGVVSNGCHARNCVEFIVTGVEASILADYTVFPNPVKGKLQVAHKGGKPFALELIHITGARACQAGGHTSYEVDTEGYAPGLYILRINGQGAMKIIKQ
ncbi:ASPIC/UnbV domain-containing protein [Dawidia soli]|uniref:T9SS type A sorting domain-containing protein n=1 Tax=Dawidia soli TaxID=2782352 RepID=A0AAP2DH00_9BACT|nr:ASPIC/UnbV domain-containing protein [Dawidia soli]MBT1689202.1 T9SS type A sorting domain-containing protein [Dawidia soli]